ncbi:hypothetical protein PAHAL_5G096000 [Panicum hallii]|uniref:Uncharacterized protein n=1 Tax=Panicum hallii TaxID=206008 RepID=A0A2T8IJG5_9POAL|nr:hypothetical protein PAHAL_5G096000 [Panicum hallii]
MGRGRSHTLRFALLKQSDAGREGAGDKYRAPDPRNRSGGGARARPRSQPCTRKKKGHLPTAGDAKLCFCLAFRAFLLGDAVLSVSASSTADTIASV